MAERLGDAILELRTDDRRLRRGLRTAEGGANRLNAVFKTVGATIAAAFSVRVVTNFAKEIVSVASAAEETANKFNVVFGASAAAARAELQDLTATIPLTVAEMEAMASGIQDLLVPMGVARDQASGMSVDLLQLAGDIASFNNVDATQVLDAMKSALAGSSEPMRRFGVDTRVTRLETLAFEQGLISAGEELDNAATAQAVMLAIQRDSSDAMGDAARTVDSTANSMRFFGRESRQLREELGKFLLPTVGEVAGALADVTANLQEFATTEEGVQFSEDLAEAVGDLTGELVELFNILQELRPLLSAVFTLLEAQLNNLRLLARVVEASTTQIRIGAAALELFRGEAEKTPDLAPQFAGIGKALDEANDEIDRLMKEGVERMKRDVPDAAGAVDDLGEEAAKTARQLDQELAQAMIRLNNLAEDLERQIGDDLADFLGLDDPVKIEFEVEAPDIDVVDLFGIPEVEREVNEAFARIAERVTQDVGRAIAQAIISGDVDNAIDAFSRALEAAVADALTQAIAEAFAEAALSTVAAASFVGIILARLFEVGPFEKDTGRRLGGDVTIGPGGVTTPPDFESASRETAAAFAALDAAITEGMNELQETLRFEIPAGFEDTVVFIQARVKDGREMFDVIFRDFAEGLEAATATFESAEAAAGFALQKFTQSLLDQGVQFDAAVTELIQGFGAGLDPTEAGFENFEDALTRVQDLADQAAMSLDGVTEVELALQKIGPQAQALARELTGLGLSAAETRRLVGGQLVQSFQTLRQQITGEELSVARRREIAEANAALFNAELELQIVRLEAERDALIASAGIAQQEATLNSNVIDARSRFVQAQGEVSRAEIGVMEGFIKSAGSVVKAGVELIGDTAVALGTALGALPEEIRKQVQAIQKVIDALRRIGTISPGDIRIPGAGRIPGPAPIGRAGRGIDRAARSAREELDRLIRSLDDLAAESIRNIDVLEGAVDGLAALRDEIRLTTQAPGQQLETVRSRLFSAAARFRAGDVGAAADVQQLGRLFSQLVGRQFASTTAGFLANQRFLEDLLNETIRSGEEQLATERDLLESLNDRQADLLQQLVALGELSQDEIDEIRARGEEQTGATRDVEDRIQEMNATINKLARAVERLAQQAARNAA